MNEKTYKVSAPIGSIVIPKEQMTEKELREFVVQLIQDPQESETWREKAEKDPIGSVVEWLENNGYSIN